MIVVTGAAGFIGSALLKQLNENGWDQLIAVDDLGKSEKWKNLVGKRFVDLISKHDLLRWLAQHENKVSAIFHLGACSSTVETDASYLLENNYRYSVRLCEAALRGSYRFIYASSAATYGDGMQGFRDDHVQLGHLAPLNMYGYSKHLFDLWLQHNQLLDKVVGLKYFNVFGPNEHHKGRMASAITHILPTAQKEGVIRLFKSSEPAHYQDGGQMRDFIYVKDVVRMTSSFLHSPATGIFNIGTGKPGTWNEMAQGVFEALNLPSRIDYIEMPKDLMGKYQNYTCADMNKTSGVLGQATLCRPFKESVIEYVRDYLLPNKQW